MNSHLPRVFTTPLLASLVLASALTVGSCGGCEAPAEDASQPAAATPPAASERPPSAAREALADEQTEAPRDQEGMIDEMTTGSDMDVLPPPPPRAREELPEGAG